MEFPEAFVDELLQTATVAVAELSERLQGESLWVSKGFLAKVHGCEVRHLAPDDFAWKPSTAAGFVALVLLDRRLSRSAPQSPNTARAKQVCGIDATPPR